MKSCHIAITAVYLALAACADQDPDGTANVAADRGVNASAAMDAEGSRPPSVGALGLTVDQLASADLVDSTGREIGEVERAVTDSDGTVTSLLVEIEDTDPDRFVTLPLAGLVVVPDHSGADLQTERTRQDLLAMPSRDR